MDLFFEFFYKCKQGFLEKLKLHAQDVKADFFETTFEEYMQKRTTEIKRIFDTAKALKLKNKQKLLEASGRALLMEHDRKLLHQIKLVRLPPSY